MGPGFAGSLAEIPPLREPGNRRSQDENHDGGSDEGGTTNLSPCSPIERREEPVTLWVDWVKQDGNTEPVTQLAT